MFNTTNIGRDIREKWTDLFARLHLHYLEVPYTQLLQQNRNRAHPVPEAVISRLLDQLDIPVQRSARRAISRRRQPIPKSFVRGKKEEPFPPRDRKPKGG